VTPQEVFEEERKQVWSKVEDATTDMLMMCETLAHFVAHAAIEGDSVALDMLALWQRCDDTYRTAIMAGHEFARSCEQRGWA
jgi:hypothetical protein